MSGVFASLTLSDLADSITTPIATAAYFATQMRYLNFDDLLFLLAYLVILPLMAYSLAFAFNIASTRMELF